jgi:hypothetical protein
VRRKEHVRCFFNRRDVALSLSHPCASDILCPQLTNPLALHVHSEEVCCPSDATCVLACTLLRVPPRYLRTCNNRLQGELPTWIATMTNLTQQFLTVNQCEQSVSQCAPGYTCTASSMSLVANPCPPGQYSLGGASVCSLCPAGTFSDVEAATTAACSGGCRAGYACPAGSPNSTAVRCPSGRYSGAGVANCTACPGAAPYSIPGSVSPTGCVSVCPDSGWTLWLDGAGVEGAHSCFQRSLEVVAWGDANATCWGMGAGVHLLTSRQVGAVVLMDKGVGLAPKPRHRHPACPLGASLHRGRGDCLFVAPTALVSVSCAHVMWPNRVLFTAMNEAVGASQRYQDPPWSSLREWLAARLVAGGLSHRQCGHSGLELGGRHQRLQPQLRHHGLWALDGVGALAKRPLRCAGAQGEPRGG